MIKIFSLGTRLGLYVTVGAVAVIAPMSRAVSATQGPSTANTAWGVSEADFAFRPDNEIAFASHVPQRLTELRSAAATGDSTAMLLLATAYRYAIGVEKDDAAGKQWLVQAAAAKNPYARYVLSYESFQEDSNPSPAKLAELVKIADQYEWPDMLVQVGYILVHGSAAIKDEKKGNEFFQRARAKFEKAVASGDLRAATAYASDLSVEWFGTTDIPKARSLFQQAVAGGYVAAKYPLAFLLLRSSEDGADTATALRLLEETRTAGSPLATNALANFYAGNRKGVPVDYARAKQLYQEAADGGLTVAKKSVAAQNRRDALPGMFKVLAAGQWKAYVPSVSGFGTEALSFSNTVATSALYVPSEGPFTFSTSNGGVVTNDVFTLSGPANGGVCEKVQQSSTCGIFKVDDKLLTVVFDNGSIRKYSLVKPNVILVSNSAQPDTGLFEARAFDTDPDVRILAAQAVAESRQALEAQSRPASAKFAQEEAIRQKERDAERKRDLEESAARNRENQRQSNEAIMEMMRNMPHR